MKKFLLRILCLSVVYILFNFTYLDTLPKIGYDESSYANTAYNFIQHHQLQNTLNSLGGEDFCFYPLVLSVFFKLFGTSLWVGRFCSAFLGLLSLFFFLALLHKAQLKPWVQWICGGLFCINTTLVAVFRTIRPESLIVCLLLAALYFLNPKPSRSWIFAICLAALCMTHPIGVILAFFLGLHWLFLSLKTSHFKATLIVFGIVFGTVFLVWNSLLISQGHASVFHLILSQFFSGRVSSQGALTHNLSQLWSSYFLNGKRGLIATVELGFLVGAFSLNTSKRTVKVIAAISLIFLGLGLLFLNPFLPRYMAVISVIALYCGSHWMNHYFESGKKTLFLSIVLLAFSLNHIVGLGYLWKQQHRNASFSIIEQTLSKEIPINETVFTHIQLWFPFKNQSVICHATQAKYIHSIPQWVVYSPNLAQGFSPATNTATYKNPQIKNDYFKIRPGKQFYFEGYGTIYIMKIPNNLN